MVHAALGGELDGVATRTDPVFGVEVPQRVEGVPDELLDPRRTWADPAAYDAQAAKLADMFVKNFAQFEAQVGAEVVEAARGRARLTPLARGAEQAAPYLGAVVRGGSCARPGEARHSGSGAPSQYPCA